MKVNLTIGIPSWLDRICTWPTMWYRRRKYGYSFRRIDLGEGQWTILDQGDYYRLNNFKWCISGNGKQFYAVRLIKKGQGRTKIEYLHRVIMEPKKGLVVDHKNGDKLDNRRDNLRIATHWQNSCNKPKRQNTLSRFNGVTLDKRCGRWEGQIYCNGKRIRLGRFDSEIEAARAYDAAARTYHGEFARLNFPD